MKPIEKVSLELKAKFPEISPAVMRGVLYSLWFKPGKQESWQKRLDDLFSEDNEPPSQKERDEVLYEALLKSGEHICEDKEFLLLIEKAIKQVQKVRAKRLIETHQVSPTVEETSPAHKSKRHQPGGH